MYPFFLTSLETHTAETKPVNLLVSKIVLLARLKHLSPVYKLDLV